LALRKPVRAVPWRCQVVAAPRAAHCRYQAAPQRLAQAAHCALLAALRRLGGVALLSWSRVMDFRVAIHRLRQARLFPARRVQLFWPQLRRQEAVLVILKSSLMSAATLVLMYLLLQARLTNRPCMVVRCPPRQAAGTQVVPSRLVLAGAMYALETLLLMPDKVRCICLPGLPPALADKHMSVVEARYQLAPMYCWLVALHLCAVVAVSRVAVSRWPLQRLLWVHRETLL
jgi:hypothetical protein